MNISEIGLSINGHPFPYSEPLKLKFDEGEYIRAYHALFTTGETTSVGLIF